jgi:hypothetical protein
MNVTTILHSGMLIGIDTFPVVETTGYIEIPHIKKKHSLRFQPQDAMYMTNDITFWNVDCQLIRFPWFQPRAMLKYHTQKAKHSLRFQPQDAMYMTTILHSGMLIGIDTFPVVETTSYIKNTQKTLPVV